jgi:hypothetical protein
MSGSNPGHDSIDIVSDSGGGGMVAKDFGVDSWKRDWICGDTRADCADAKSFSTGGTEKCRGQVRESHLLERRGTRGERPKRWRDGLTSRQAGAQPVAPLPRRCKDCAGERARQASPGSFSRRTLRFGESGGEPPHSIYVVARLRLGRRPGVPYGCARNFASGSQ